jgi:hypothetical protein
MARKQTKETREADRNHTKVHRYLAHVCSQPCARRGSRSGVEFEEFGTDAPGCSLVQNQRNVVLMDVAIPFVCPCCTHVLNFRHADQTDNAGKKTELSLGPPRYFFWTFVLRHLIMIEEGQNETKSSIWPRSGQDKNVDVVNKCKRSARFAVRLLPMALQSILHLF